MPSIIFWLIFLTVILSGLILLIPEKKEIKYVKIANSRIPRVG
jgi:hypothetical protein